jgi:hypothetical protein
MISNLEVFRDFMSFMRSKVSFFMRLKAKQVGRSTILSLTIKIDLVRLSFGLCSIKSNNALIEHNCRPDLVRLMLCSTISVDSCSVLIRGSTF